MGPPGYNGTAGEKGQKGEDAPFIDVTKVNMKLLCIQI